MKLMIDIPEKVVTAIQNGEDYRYDIHTAIAQGIPYEEMPQGDLISRNALREVINNAVDEEIRFDQAWAMGLKYSLKLIDNAPTVEPEVYMNGKDYDLYLEGYKQGKKDFERPQGGCEKCPFKHTEKCDVCINRLMNMRKEPNRPQSEFTDLEQKVIADSINYLLGAELLEENGYTEEVINALKSVLQKIDAEENHI